VPKKIRVYELARELGISNKETLDLCEALGIGVKSHSSSIVDAQADRVRRKAEREGLGTVASAEEPARQTVPQSAAVVSSAGSARPEPVPQAAEEATPAPTAERPTRPRTAPQAAATVEIEKDDGSQTPAAQVAAPATDEAASPVPPPPPAPSEPPTPAAADDTGSEAKPAARSIPPPPPPPSPPPAPATSRPAISRPAAEAEPGNGAATGTEPAREAPSRGRTEEALPGPRTLVTSSGQEEARPTRPAPELTREEAPAARAARPVAPTQRVPPPPPMTTGPDGKAMPPPPQLRSTSGKRIPPPPPPPKSSSGRPIPPPPGGAPARRSSPPTQPSPGAYRGGPPPRRGAGRSQVPGAGGGPGGPRGAPPRGRRKGRRRRRQLEELEPQELPTYTPDDAPIPEGEIIVERGSTAQELSPKLNRSAADVVRFLLQQGEMVTATQSLSDDMIELFGAEIGADVRLVDPGTEQEEELQKLLHVSRPEEEDDEELTARPPVITVMGHVDHGKTLLLDRIRKTNVVDAEAGGITQHIGAYQVERDGHPITFLDTPGHEAFTAMRARGARSTDIVVLVVAADDGVMPQTVEAIQHANVADVPIVVALNKIDRPNADPQRVLGQLTEHGLIPESYSGDVVTVEVSALTGDGIDELLDQLLLVAEVEELTASAEGRAAGVVLESYLDKGRGPVATVLVQQGTLEIGDPVVAGAAWGRVRAMLDDLGQPERSAGPSTPVQVLGLSEVARAGDTFVVAPDEKTAGKVAETREHWHRQASMADSAAMGSGGAKLEDIFTQIQAGETATLNLVLKADVHGSLEAVTESLRKLETDDVRLSFVARGVGGITESDVQLATVSNATIIGFGVRPDRKARELAEEEGVEIRLYEIIYELLEDTELAMVGQLAPTFEEVVTGDAEVREVFSVPRVGKVAGCYVQNGVITRGSKVRFLRDGVIIWKGTITSLKRFKDDVREVQAGYECGIGLSDFQDLKGGDVIETFDEREVERSLTS